MITRIILKTDSLCPARDFYRIAKINALRAQILCNFPCRFCEESLSINALKKPVHKFFVNTGIYVLEPEMIEQIPSNFFNMTDLLMQSMPEGKVVAFPVHEYWIDIGQFEDFYKATADYYKVFLRGK